MWPKRTAPTLGMMIWLVVCLPPPAQAETGQPLKTITNSIGMSLVRIEPDEFWMGTLTSAQDVAEVFKEEGVIAKNLEADYPRHKVRLTKPFCMGKYEVTKGDFRNFVAATNYQTDAERRNTGALNEMASKAQKGPQFTWQDAGWKPYGETHPVVNVTWNDAQRFCKWLSQKEKALYRLPTEAEWEYACRAGTETLFWNGDTPEKLTQIANVPDGTGKEKFPDWPTMVKGRDGYIFPAPVGMFPANPWGLHDMHGNVAEWVADVYDASAYRNRSGMPISIDPYTASVPSGPVSRVYRGGNFYLRSVYVRSAARASNLPNYAVGGLGFRVVLALNP